MPIDVHVVNYTNASSFYEATRNTVYVTPTIGIDRVPGDLNVISDLITAMNEVDTLGFRVAAFILGRWTYEQVTSPRHRTSAVQMDRRGDTTFEGTPILVDSARKDWVQALIRPESRHHVWARTHIITRYNGPDGSVIRTHP